MSPRRHSRRRIGLRPVVGACCGSIFLAFVAAAYVDEPGGAAPPGSVVLPALPTATETSVASSTATRGLDSRASTSPWPVAKGTSGVYTPIVRNVDAHMTPSSTSRVVGRLTTRTPEGTTTLVPVLRRVERSGALWLEVGLPVLPNGTTGWVPRRATGGYGFTSTRLEISRTTLRAVLYRGRTRVFSAPVGIGQARWPTPVGWFIVRSRLTKYSSATYGPLAFGTSARSAVLTDWPAGGFIGIHGTNQPSLIPGRISHGCIRLRNSDILALGRLMPVGTPVIVR
jgi:lipoprotein-anchoring transpeptidase ErfK/SrfK